MVSTNLNHFDKNCPDKVSNARKFVKGLPRALGMYAVAHFDLTSSTKKMQKNQEDTITEMLTHNKICHNLIEENGGIIVKELGDTMSSPPNMILITVLENQTQVL